MYTRVRRSLIFIRYARAAGIGRLSFVICGDATRAKSDLVVRVIFRIDTVCRMDFLPRDANVFTLC